MKPIHYEFEIYDDIIHGELKPKKLTLTKRRLLVNFMKEEFDECQSIILAEFKKNANKYILIKEKSLLNAHPLAKKILSQHALRFESDSNFNLPNYIIRQINSDVSKAIDTFEIKANSKRIIGFLLESKWEEIQIDRLKYCYFHRLLKSNNLEIKKRMRKTLFSLDEEVLRQFVERAQQTLLGFMNYISQKYNFELEEIHYQIKEQYTDRDCMILVYLSLVDLIKCLEKEQRKYIDKSAVVPMNNELIAHYEITEKYKYIKELVENLDIGLKWSNKIIEPLEKFNELNIMSSITYLDLKFFKQLHYELITVATELKSNFNEDHLIKVFFEVNYNHLSVMEFIVDRIRKSIENIKNPEKKKLILLERKKCISQIINTSNTCFQDKVQPLNKTIISWIDKEIEFIEFSANDNSVSVSGTKTSNKLFTELKVPEIALLFKLLHESKTVEPKSISKLNKWISENISNEHTDEISPNKLKNSMYDYNEKTIDTVKSKLIEMINQLNQL